MKLNPTLNYQFLCRKTELLLRPKFSCSCMYFHWCRTQLANNHPFAFVSFRLQAYKKMNKDLKKEQIEILKTKYGIDLEKDK